MGSLKELLKSSTTSNNSLAHELKHVDDELTAERRAAELLRSQLADVRRKEDEEAVERARLAAAKEHLQAQLLQAKEEAAEEKRRGAEAEVQWEESFQALKREASEGSKERDLLRDKFQVCASMCLDVSKALTSCKLPLAP